MTRLLHFNRRWTLEDDVQDQEVVEETTEETTEPEQVETQLSADERIAALETQLVGLNKATSAFQSEKDKAVRDSQRYQQEVVTEKRRRESAEKTLTDTARGYEESDPGVAERLRGAKAQQQLQYYQQREVEDTQRRQAREIYSGFRNDWEEHLGEMGVDSSKIDWGDDTEGLLQKNKRIQASVSRIQKDNAAGTEKRLRGEAETRHQQTRKELGLDSQDNIPASGGGAVADELKKYGDGELDFDQLSPAAQQRVQ